MSNQTQFKTAYSEKTKKSMTFPPNSRWTKQEFKAESDINKIMARYQRTGEIHAINNVAPQYLDVTGADFQRHQEIIAGAKSLFESMPSSLRSRFDNDPAKFLDFTSDPKNRVEMAELGLLNEKATQAILTPVPAPEPAQNGEESGESQA